MKPPRREKVNGYWVMKASDGWEVANDDRRQAGPFATESEAIAAARKLLSKG